MRKSFQKIAIVLLAAITLNTPCLLADELIDDNFCVSEQEITIPEGECIVEENEVPATSFQEVPMNSEQEDPELAFGAKPSKNSIIKKKDKLNNADADPIQYQCKFEDKTEVCPGCAALDGSRCGVSAVSFGIAVLAIVLAGVIISGA